MQPLFRAAHERVGNVRTICSRAFATVGFVLSAFGTTFIMTDAAMNGLPVAKYLRLRVSAIGQLFAQDDSKPDADLRSAAPLTHSAAPQYPASYDSGKVFHIPGLRLPSVNSADEATLPDQTPVIGVVIEGHSRAYLPEAMQDLSTHVINDRIGEVPVTVTHCAMLKCTRVFTRAGTIEPLDVSLVGVHHGEMTLQIDGERMAQDAPDLPVDDLEFSRTSWGEWKTSHPQTDVFIGNVLDHSSVTAD